MKLSAQSQRTADAMGAIQTIRPAYWLAIDPDAGSAQAIAAQGTRLLVRYYGQRYDFVGAPQNAVTAEAFVSYCAAQPSFPYAWAVLTPVGNAQADPNWLAAIVRGLAALGKECIVGNWSTGNDGLYVPGAKLFGCQEYGDPSMPASAPYNTLRYRSWFPAIRAQEPSARLFITECGITQAVNGGPDIGYRSLGQSPAEYWQSSLVWYEAQLAQDSYVEAAFIFGCGMNSDWATFEVLGTPVVGYLAGRTPSAGAGAGTPPPSATPAPAPPAVGAWLRANWKLAALGGVVVVAVLASSGGGAPRQIRYPLA